MAVLDGTYPALLGGVSQQHPNMALPSQVRAMTNMLVDPLTGPRRRPGTKARATARPVGAEGVISFFSEVGASQYHGVIQLKGAASTVTLYREDWIEAMHSTFASPAYFEGATVGDIAVAFLRGEVFVLNRAKKPVLQDPNTDYLQDPSKTGFLHIKAGAFSTRYHISLDGGAWWAYDTPSGTAAGDAEKAGPEYIAAQLATYVNAATGTTGITAYAKDGCIFFSGTGTTPVRILSSTSTAYVRASTAMRVPSVADLPPRMPPQANDCVCSVGTSTDALQYYRWDASTLSWSECGQYGSYEKIGDMPQCIRQDSGGALLVSDLEWVGRYAGDDTTSPYPAFTDEIGITGISSFQGRLVLLSGSYVCLSESRRPTVFMRTTVGSLLDSDPIEVASGSTSSATFRTAAQYNRDLLLFADGQISVLPGANVLTPRSAQIIPSNTLNVNTTAQPVQAGNMLVFPVPGATGEQYSGFASMYPSSSTLSQYGTEPLAAHLPRYFPSGYARSAASGGGGLCAWHFEQEPHSLYLFQYMWAGGELQYQAWHRWTFSQSIMSVHAFRDELALAFRVPTGGAGFQVALCSVSPSAKVDLVGGTSAQYTPFLDAAVELEWTSAADAFVPRYPGVQTAVCAADWPLRGEPVGFTVSEDLKITLHSSAPRPAKYYFGIPYTSSVELNAPVLRDRNNAPYLTEGTYWQTLQATLRDSGEFTAEVYQYQQLVYSHEFNAVSWSTPGFAPGVSRVSEYSAVHLPVVGATAGTSVALRTSGLREMNFSNFEYTVKTGKMHRRV